MPLHTVKKSIGILDVPVVYVSELAARSLSRGRMPDHGSPAAVAASLVRDELMMDGNSRQNLATFCTTRVSAEVRDLMQDCVDKNMIDKDEYPQTAEVESRCVHIVADLWNAPDAADAMGCSTTGPAKRPCWAGWP